MIINDRKSPDGISCEAQTAYSTSSTDLPIHADMHANLFDMHPDAIPEIPAGLYSMHISLLL